MIKPKEGEKIELQDLDWVEKEKIIRILFTKVNAGVTPGYWREIEQLGHQRSSQIDAEDYQDGQDEYYDIQAQVDEKSNYEEEQN